MERVELKAIKERNDLALGSCNTKLKPGWLLESAKDVPVLLERCERLEGALREVHELVYSGRSDKSVDAVVRAALKEQEG